MSDEEPTEEPTKEQVCLVEIEKLCRNNTRWSKLAGIILRMISDMKSDKPVKAKVKYGILPPRRRGGG